MTISNSMQPAASLAPREWLTLYLEGQHDTLAEKLLERLQHFQQRAYLSLDEKGRYFVNSFVQQLLYLLCRPDFVPSDQWIVRFVLSNPLISNLVAVSGFHTTDGWLELIRNQEHNYFKILTLYSARNSVRFDRRSLVSANPALASLWYNAYAQLYRCGLADRMVLENLKEHFAFHDERLSYARDPQELAFGVTYVDQQAEPSVKRRVNESLQTVLAPWQQRVRNTPNPRKIAVMSSMWRSNHSVFRIQHAYLKSLSDYHLTLVQFGKNQHTDTDLFDDVIVYERAGEAFNPEQLLVNDFGMIYYPDVGMSGPSLMFSNLRLAPLQVASLGHSVSPWGAEIDYFISGAQAEPEHPERNYSERLVLLRGSGAIHEKPRYSPKGLRNESEYVLINCPWSSQKINSDFLEAIREIIDRSRKSLHLRLFAGAALTRTTDFLPFVQDVRRALDERARIEIAPPYHYDTYMEQMERGDLCLDSFHFGGCNTIADVLFLRKPTVTWEGNRWYSRIGSQMLRQIGMEELIATSRDEYVSLALRLIEDETYRQSVARRIENADLDATIFNHADADDFRQAIDFLFANHETLKQSSDRAPIVIPPPRAAAKAEPARRSWGRPKR
jgi:hypothetical protein